MSLIPGCVGYVSYPIFIEPTNTWVPLGFSGYIWLDTKNCVNKSLQIVQGFDGTGRGYRGRGHRGGQCNSWAHPGRHSNIGQ